MDGHLLAREFDNAERWDGPAGPPSVVREAFRGPLVAGSDHIPCHIPRKGRKLRLVSAKVTGTGVQSYALVTTKVLHAWVASFSTVPPPTRCDGSKQVANACRVARVGIACAAVYPVAFALRSRFLLCDGRSVPLLFFCMVRTSAGSAAPVPCSAFLKLLWRCQCAGSALPAQWPACHFAPWLPPRAMGDGAAQAPVAWHLGWLRSTPGGHVTKLVPQRIAAGAVGGAPRPALAHSDPARQRRGGGTEAAMTSAGEGKNDFVRQAFGPRHCNGCAT